VGKYTLWACWVTLYSKRHNTTVGANLGIVAPTQVNDQCNVQLALKLIFYHHSWRWRTGRSPPLIYKQRSYIMIYRRTFFGLLCGLGCALTVWAADASGKWTTTISTQIGELAYTYEFKVEGDKLTGKSKSQFGDVEITEGKVTGDEITFVENISFDGNAIRIDYKGKVAGDEIKFTRKVGEFATEEFVAKRAK
jgi:hypothetical protein